MQNERKSQGLTFINVAALYVGTIMGAAFAIDYMKWPEVLGTIAGDDTVFVAMENKEGVASLLKRLKEYR